MRFQPRRGTPFAEVIEWLNSMPNEEKREKLEELCLMLLLPYVRKAKLDRESGEIESCYWSTHNRVIQYLYIMQQTLGIKTIGPITSVSSILTVGEVQSVDDEVDLEEEEFDDFRSTNSLLGIGQ